MKEKRTLSLLLADDDEDDRMIFTEIVTQLENEVHLRTVSDGQQLIQLLTGNGTALPDLIFLDLNMPNKNGKECLKEIKAHPALNHLPVIIYSTSGADKDIREAYKHGASLYIQKPSNMKGLRKTLSEVLSIDWSNGHPRFNEDNFLLKAARVKHILSLGAAGLARYFSGQPGPLPVSSIV